MGEAEWRPHLHSVGGGTAREEYRRLFGSEMAAMLSFAGAAYAPFHPSFPVYSDNNELAAAGVSSWLLDELHCRTRDEEDGQRSYLSSPSCNKKNLH